VSSLTIALLLAASTPATAQSISRCSVSSSGAQGNFESEWPSVSFDGRYVAFTSRASTLVAGDTNGFFDVMVRDRAAQTTVRASVSSAGVEGNQTSGSPALSGSGRNVAFQSGASNLVAGDTNGHADIFVRDLQTSTTLRVGPAGVQGDGHSYWPAVSFDGRCIAFFSGSTNLVPSDTNGVNDVFLHDLATGVTTRVSVSSSAAQANGESDKPNLSGDGRYVAFGSTATNLVAGDTNGARDAFVRDVLAGTTEIVSTGATQSNGDTFDPWLSLDGRWVAFTSAANNLVVGDTNGFSDCFLRDLASGVTTLVSLGPGSVHGDGNSLGARVSAHGERITFWSFATNLVPADFNSSWDVFVRDRVSGATERASVDALGIEGDRESIQSAPSGDGRVVVFKSSATNLVPGDTNSAADVFARELAILPPAAYCTAGTTSSGCVPRMSSTGTPSATGASPFTLSVTNAEGQRTGLLFYGLQTLEFGAPAWGPSGSYLCVKSPTQRTSAQSTGGTLFGCDGAISVDWNAYVASHMYALGVPFSAGDDVFAQAWMRDPPTAKSTHLSDGLRFTLTP
jgi:Tol biopolymer transport system component